MSHTSRMKPSPATQKQSRPSQTRRFMMSRRSAPPHPGSLRVPMISQGLMLPAPLRPASPWRAPYLPPLLKASGPQTPNSSLTPPTCPLTRRR
uniref:Uncharacterized protein n=1 Tax=Sarcophilus harrisii TaxID=9305 RepID=A0A7N4PYX1_SARHA